MARAEDIRDERSVRAWLEGRPNDDDFKLALRAAQRAAPTIWKSPNLDLRSTDASGLPFLRALLTAGVASRSGTLASALSAIGFAERGKVAASRPDVADSAHHAAARQAVTSVVEAISSMERVDPAGTQMHSAQAISSAMFVARIYAEDDLEWKLLRSDAIHIEAGRDPAELPLYPDEAGRAVPRAIDAIQINLGKDPAVWDFWLRWWDGVLTGKQVDWALQEKVVTLIPEEVWEAGPRAVAEAIREIEERLPSGSNEPISPSRALERNRRAVALQLDALGEFVSQEIERLRGQNNFSNADDEQRQERIGKLGKIVEAVSLMREALADEPECTKALVVVQAQLPVVVEAASEVVELGGEPQVSEVIATMAITIKHLTDAGTPGGIATAIAFADTCWKKIAVWRKRHRA